MNNIIITGASGNLGAAVVEKFLNSGYKIIATVSNKDAISSLRAHPHLEVQAVNLMNEQEAADFVHHAILKNKIIHGALMLVGGYAPGNMEVTSGDDLRKQYALNFETAYFIARPLYAHMISQDYGRLVFTGARPALDAQAGSTAMAYALSKSLLFRLAEFLNAEAKNKNVTATVIVPGTIDTPANRKSMTEANFENWVKPSEIADLVEIIFSGEGNALRETVLKVYGKS